MSKSSTIPTVTNYKAVSTKDDVEVSFNFGGRKYVRKFTENDFPVLSYGRTNFKNIFENYDKPISKETRHEIKFKKHGSDRVDITLRVHTGLISGLVNLIKKSKHLEYEFTLEPEKNAVVNSVTGAINDASNSMTSYLDKMTNISAIDVVKKFF